MLIHRNTSLITLLKIVILCSFFLLKWTRITYSKHGGLYEEEFIDDDDKMNSLPKSDNKKKLFGKDILKENLSVPVERILNLVNGSFSTSVSKKNSDRVKRTKKLDMVVKAQKIMGLPNLNMDELMSKNSTWEFSTRFSNTTIILNHWKRDSLNAQLEAILAQNVKPALVWVCAFDSPKVSEYREIVKQYEKSFEPGVLTLTESDFNFKYYGRFQLALQAPTDFVWVIDDDMIPGPKMLALLTYILNVKELRAGAVGTIGWIMPPLKEKTHQFLSYRSGELHGGLYFESLTFGVRVKQLVAADLLCSHWFMRTVHVPLLFRQKWLTSGTAEDYMLAYSLRRFANLESFVIPSVEADAATWGNLDTQQNFAEKFPTTDKTMVRLRRDIWQELIMCGGTYHWLRYRHHMRMTKDTLDLELQAKIQADFSTLTDATSLPPTISVMFFIDGVEEAQALGYAHHKIGTSKTPSMELLTAITGGKRDPCKVVVAELPLYRKNALHICYGDEYGLFDMKFGRNTDRTPSSVNVFLDVYDGMHTILDSVGYDQLMPLMIGMDALTAKDVKNAKYSVTSALKKVAKQKNVKLLLLKPHECNAAATFATLNVKAISAWKIPVFTAVIVHMGNNLKLLKGALRAFQYAYFLGDTVDLIVLMGPDSTDQEWSAAKSFDWSNGKTTLKPLIRSRHWSVAAFESLQLMQQHSFVIVIDTQQKVDRFFYLWSKFEALASMLNPVDAQQEVQLGLSYSSIGVGHVFSKKSWQSAQQMCVSTLLSGQTDCEKIFKNQTSFNFPPSNVHLMTDILAINFPIKEFEDADQEILHLLQPAIIQVPSPVRDKKPQQNPSEQDVKGMQKVKKIDVRAAN